MCLANDDLPTQLFWLGKSLLSTEIYFSGSDYILNEGW